jgi:hypothetical protein
MQYVNYEEAIVQRYGVVLEGWTFDRFVNPSELSTALPPLQKLLDALNDGSCKFVKLTREQRKAREKAYLTKLASGEVQVRERKTRKDAGIRRKRKQKLSKKTSGSNGGGDLDDADSTTTDDEARPKKRHRPAKSAPVIYSSSEDGNDSDST